MREKIGISYEDIEIRYEKEEEEKKGGEKVSRNKAGQGAANLKASEDFMKTGSFNSKMINNKNVRERFQEATQVVKGLEQKINEELNTFTIKIEGLPLKEFSDFKVINQLTIRDFLQNIEAIEGSKYLFDKDYYAQIEESIKRKFMTEIDSIN